MLQQSRRLSVARQVLAEEEGWKAAMARAGGQRVLDDPKRLSRCAPRPAAAQRTCRAEARLTWGPARQVAEEGDQAEGEEGAGLGRAPGAPAQGAGRQAGQVRPLRPPWPALVLCCGGWMDWQACATPFWLLRDAALQAHGQPDGAGECQAGKAQGQAREEAHARRL